MAPQLRSRKSKDTLTDEKPAAVKKAVVKAAKSPKTEKRKANEDASPIATKKARSSRAKKVVEEVKEDDVDAATPVKGKKNKKPDAPAAEAMEVDEASAPTPKSALKKAKASPAAPKTNGTTPVSEKKKSTKKSTPAKKAEQEKKEEVAPEQEAAEEEDEEEMDAQTQALVQALEDDNSDSEAEDGSGDKKAPTSTYKEGQDVGKIPKPKKSSKSSKSTAAAGTPTIKGKPGVVYLGRIPHGFYEHQIRAYFEQFGPLNHVRLARNKKTGASRHHAFVEFADADTADIAARTMDKYLLFGHILTAKVVPPGDVHPDLFKGANRRFKVVPWNKMAGKQLEKALPESKWAGRIGKEEQRRRERAEKLKAMGYEFEAPALKKAVAKDLPAVEGGEEEVKAIEESKEDAKEEAPVVVEETKAEETPVKAAKSPASSAKKAAKGGKKGKKVKA